MKMSKFVRYTGRGGNIGYIALDQYSHFTKWSTDDVGFIHTKTGKTIEIIYCNEFMRGFKKAITPEDDGQQDVHKPS